MGTFQMPGYSRAQLIAYLVEETEKAFVLRKFCSGNVLWSLWQAKDADESNNHSRFIRCDIMRRDKDGWAYQPLSEAAGPNHASCPKIFLDAAADRNTEWRLRVYKYWEERKFKKQDKQRRRDAELLRYGAKNIRRR